jgi:hypothetical protein
MSSRVKGGSDPEARHRQRMRRLAAAAFLVSAAGTVLFAVAYFWVGRQHLGLTQNELLGSGLGLAM